MALAANMKRRWLVPEVIQTSAMDCGPAALKALFGGYGQYLSYGRLREACQTDVDGTSIDALEGIAQGLGLEVAQSMLPADLLLLKDSACLPALIVVELPDGGTHVVVLWRVHGPWLQIMDPGAGRLWVHRDVFLRTLYRHEQAVPVTAWDEWSMSPPFTAGLTQRLKDLGVSSSLSTERAALDAALRLGCVLLQAKQLQRGREAQAFLDACAADPANIPDQYWAIRPCPDDAAQVLLRGAVLIAARGQLLPVDTCELPETLARAKTEPPPRVWQPVWEALRASGARLQAACLGALCASACGLVLEALLFRGLFDLGRHLQSTAARVGGVAAILVFLVALLGLNWPTSLALLRVGRQLEIRLRVQLLAKVPRLEDRYFQSRLISDMAFRAHSLQLLRTLPFIAGHAFNIGANLLVTGLAVAWIYPGSALLVSAAVLASCVVPLLALPAMGARDLRSREFNAALSSLYLETLQGARALQAHGGAHGMLALQSVLLGEWRAARLRQQALIIGVNVLHMGITLSLIIALVFRQAAMTQSPAGLLLLIYWTTSIPMLGAEVATLAQGLPAIRNTLLRFLELITAPTAAGEAVATAAPSGGVSIDFECVSVLVAGQPVLTDVSLQIAAGEQVAIVGASGAGKSSLLGCLLGWYRPASGTIRIDAAVLSEARQQTLRHESAWLDPQVHLFDATLYDNLRYGNAADVALGEVLEDADLTQVLRHAPLGLQAPIGEGGTRLSGGEGQRIRAARAFGRERVRLALLDEPARGLGRAQRRSLLQTARRRFAGATLLCVTHDVADTLDFDRIVVIEQGRVIEQGAPAELQARAGSRYTDLLQIERQVSAQGWAHRKWRRVRLARGRLRESLQ